MKHKNMTAKKTPKFEQDEANKEDEKQIKAFKEHMLQSWSEEQKEVKVDDFMIKGVLAHGT